MSRTITYPLINFTSHNDVHNTYDTATMAVGFVRVSNFLVFSNKVILACYNAISPHPGALSTGEIVDSSFFDIKSTNDQDSSTVNWLMLYESSLSISGNTAGIPYLLSTTVGQATLVGGTVTVPSFYTPASSNNIFVFFSTPDLSNLGFIRVSSVNPGVGFVITSTNSSDTSVINWLILKPTSDAGPFSNSGGLPMLDNAVASATYGVATLSNSQVTVNTTSVKANSIILCCTKTFGDPLHSGFVYSSPSSIVPNVSFSINSTHISDDTSSVYWWILERSDNP